MHKKRQYQNGRIPARTGASIAIIRSLPGLKLGTLTALGFFQHSGRLSLCTGFLAEDVSLVLDSWQSGPQIVPLVHGRVDLKLCSGFKAEWTSNCVLGPWQSGPQIVLWGF